MFSLAKHTQYAEVYPVPAITLVLLADEIVAIHLSPTYSVVPTSACPFLPYISTLALKLLEIMILSHFSSTIITKQIRQLQTNATQQARRFQPDSDI